MTSTGTVYKGKYYRKSFFPLESNPDVFTEVLHNLGVSKKLSFQDVLSIDEPEILAMTARPALALVLVSPTTQKYQDQRTEYEAMREPYTGKGVDEPVVWWKQTINNACGLYGILHAITNGAARKYIQPKSVIADLLEKGIPLAPEDRGLVLEGSEELERIHTAAALKGDTAAPERPDVDTVCHYTCFVPSHKNGHIYLLEGDRRSGPVDLGVSLEEGEDMLTGAGLDAIRRALELENRENLSFGLLALVETEA